MKTICEVHSDILFILQDVLYQLSMGDTSPTEKTRLKLCVGKLEDMLKLMKVATGKAFIMEQGLLLRKLMMEDAGLENKYQERKKKMKDGGFF